MKRRLLALVALFLLLPGQVAAVATVPPPSVSEQIDAELLRQFWVKDAAYVKKYYGTTHFVRLCRHEQAMALGPYIYGEQRCVLAYRQGKYAQLEVDGAPFRATVQTGKVTAVESLSEGWPKAEMKRLFPWYIRWYLFGRGYPMLIDCAANHAQTDAAAQLGLPLKFP